MGSVCEKTVFCDIITDEVTLTIIRAGKFLILARHNRAWFRSDQKGVPSFVSSFVSEFRSEFRVPSSEFCSDS